EVGGFFLGDNNSRFSAFSPGTPFLGRPFADFTARLAPGVPNPAPGAESIESVAEPFVGPGTGLAGMVQVERSSTLWGVEGNFRRGLVCCENGYLDLLFGYRGLGLDET